MEYFVQLAEHISFAKSDSWKFFVLKLQPAPTAALENKVTCQIQRNMSFVNSPNLCFKQLYYYFVAFALIHS